MARIRTIKPEMPQSQSMGRVSREARLCFILLWTLCDDEGRTRASSRMLASLLYPYDDDAPALICGWLTKLEREKSIIRYTVAGDDYIAVVNWTDHQKIDRPSKSKFPAPRNLARKARIIASPREPSSLDQGPKDQGSEDQGPRSSTAVAVLHAKGTRWSSSAVVPDAWKQEASAKRATSSLPAIDIDLTAEQFANYWSSRADRGAVKLDWKKTWMNWVTTQKANAHGPRTTGSAHTNFAIGALEAAREFTRSRGGGGVV